MITMRELLGSHNLAGCTDEQKANLADLLKRINELRKDWGQPLRITSGLRTEADMERIYKSKVYPKKSKHLFGQAVDIYDPELKLNAWLKENDSARMKQYGFWGELTTTNWTHLQIVPMSSYKAKTDVRWFNP